MGGVSCVVVFPAMFAAGRMAQLAKNIRAMLKIKGLGFESISRDDDVILVHANDPVFASSAISQLYGTRRVAIAKKAANEFDGIVSEIASTGGNLLLGGERFLVRVEGKTRGFVPKDVELAATSKIIGSKPGAKPGTEAKHDRLLYTYLTKDNAYVCIFMDECGGGLPYVPQEPDTVCAIHDELSAVSCLETVRQGYSTRIIICYKSESELLGLARLVNRIMPRMVSGTIPLEFYDLGRHTTKGAGHLGYVDLVLGVLLGQPEPRVSLALPAMVFPHGYVDGCVRRAVQAGKAPIIPLSGAGSEILERARQIGAGGKLAKAVRPKSGMAGVSEGTLNEIAGTKRSITVKVGPNNIHDILDGLGAKQ